MGRHRHGAGDRVFVLGSRLAETSSLVLFVIQIFIPLVMMLIPISIGVTMLRSGLFDVDVLINRVLAYGALTVSLWRPYNSGAWQASSTCFAR